MKSSPKSLSAPVDLCLLCCGVTRGSPRRAQDRRQLGVMIEPAIDTRPWCTKPPVFYPCRGPRTPVRSPAPCSSRRARCFRQDPGTRLHRPRQTCETRRSFTSESPQPASWRGPAEILRESPSARDFTEAAPKFLNLAPEQLAPHLSNLKSAVRACLRPTSALHGAGALRTAVGMPGLQ